MPRPPFVAFTGLSNSGKTTLIEKLIPELISRGLRVGALKHVGHEFDADQPGKDTWRYRKAGSAVTAAASASRIGLVVETDRLPGPEDLMYLFRGVDLVLVEGYKKEPIPKIFVMGSRNNASILADLDAHVIALVADRPLETHLPVFPVSDVAGLADLIIGNLARALPAAEGKSPESHG